jgi:hypothetical protein
MDSRISAHAATLTAAAKPVPPGVGSMVPPFFSIGHPTSPCRLPQLVVRQVAGLSGVALTR